MFELYGSGATLGITAMPQAEIPEDVELTFTLYADSLNTLVLRVSDADRFPKIAGACIQAAAPEGQTLEEAVQNPQQHADKAKANPGNSFEDTVVTLNGSSVRVYYAYYPNQYHDGVNWLQMTLIFPVAGYENGSVLATDAPAEATAEKEYQGYSSSDDWNHLEVFEQATPEPGSPAADTWDIPPD